MSRVLFLPILVLALTAVVWVFLSPARAPSEARATGAADRTRSVEESRLAPSPPPEPVPMAEEETAPPRSPTPATRAAAPITEAELARGHWIEGRVLFPAGTPGDEAVFVVAEGRATPGDHRVPLARDGSFRVAFREEARRGRVRIEARYLYLDEDVPWELAGPADEVVLEPKLGARIAGRVLPPAGSSGEIGGELELQCRSSLLVPSRDRWRKQPLVGASFSFDAVSPSWVSDWLYDLAYEGPLFVGRVASLRPHAGETLEVALELRRGVTLAGVVRDEDGNVLGRASVSASVRRPELSTSQHRAEVTGDDGAFLLGALHGGRIRLEAEHEGFQTLVRDLGAIAEGTALTGLELVLGSGLSIAGIVRWPDGSPARAEVELSGSSSGEEERSDSRPMTTCKSDAEGRFAFRGLARGSYRVLARATRIGDERTNWTSEVGRVVLASVSPGPRELVLTLTSGLELAGRVVDDLGLPVADFRVEARLWDGRPWYRGGEDDTRESFDETDGSFVLTGLVAGDWVLRASRVGHADSEDLRVTVPASAPAMLVLPREAQVNGIVLDPGGVPLEGATVQVATDRDMRLAGRYADNEERSDEVGAFAFDGLGPGTVFLRASGPSSAPSEITPVELAPGVRVTEVVLRLRTYATLAGELIASDGRPQVSWRVLLAAPGFERWLTTDAAGRFEATDVPPGEIRVQTSTAEGVRLERSVTAVAGEIVRIRLEPQE